jgi:hypothetical protein
MRPPRRFAAPLVVTAAALAGCASGPVHDNPPAPSFNPPPPADPTPPVVAKPVATPQVPALPPPTDPSNVHKQADGTCVEYHDVKCPPNVNCNPPPPAPVQCPPGK